MINAVRKNSSLLLFLIFISAILYSCAILNRWIVTDLGLLSYNRLWQLNISYTDFGFFRRGLVGTLLSESRINSLFSNEYFSALFIHAISIFIMTSLIAYYCFRKNIKNFLFVIGIAFSPALIIHQGYNTGNLDIFVLIISIINIFFVRNYIVFSLLLFIGVLIHEIFIFTLPAQFFAFYLYNRSNKLKILDVATIIPVITSLSAIVIILFFGKLDISELEFKDVMQNKLPNAYMKHILWSGFYEVSTSGQLNLSLSTQYHFDHIKDGRFIYALLPLFYVGILILRAVQNIYSRSEVFFLVFAVLFPLLIAFVAMDIYRWIAMSANMALLLTLKIVAKSGHTYSKWNILIAIFCLLAPFGAAGYGRPFPMHQFVLEKFFF
jgi:hypothetical protein